jgi:hypothetical protein
MTEISIVPTYQKGKYRVESNNFIIDLIEENKAIFIAVEEDHKWRNPKENEIDEAIKMGFIIFNSSKVIDDDQKFVEEWCKKNNVSLVENDSFSCENCLWVSPSLACGYKGEKVLVCKNCCYKCPQCEEPVDGNLYENCGVTTNSFGCYDCMKN